MWSSASFSHLSVKKIYFYFFQNFIIIAARSMHATTVNRVIVNGKIKEERRGVVWSKKWLILARWSILYTRKCAEVFLSMYISRMNAYCVCSTYSSASFICLFIPNIQNIHSLLQILSIFPADKTLQVWNLIQAFFFLLLPKFKKIHFRVGILLK